MDGLLYILSFLALIQGVLSLRDGIRNLRYSLSYERPPAPDRSTRVICPVRGVDPDLETNVRSLLAQTHTNYRLVFVVDSEKDAAFQVLSRYDQPGGGLEVQIAGRALEGGQKVHNLLHGIRDAREEVLVFCDGDARFPPDWLRELVAPLEDPGVAAATGYRWYRPSSSFATRLRSAWNATVAGFLGPHRNNFAWGGSMAIRRDVFERAQVARHWQGALSDDYALTRAVRALDLDIVYVPTCLLPSAGESSWRGLFEFTTRQIVITRVYAAHVWAVGLASYTLFTATFLWLALAMVGRPRLALLWLAMYALAGVRADLRLRAASKTIGDASLSRHRWFYRLVPPLVAMLYEFNFVVSIFRRRIVWKGIRYRLVSRAETHIER